MSEANDINDEVFEPNVIVEKEGYIGLITLNRPIDFNTFTVPFARELNDALMQLDDDPEVRVVVIQANGKHFSVGISLDEFKDKTPIEYREFIKKMDEHNHTIAHMKKPVIASVKGYCLANGAGLSFACDLTVAAEDAKFGTTAINVGLICLGPTGPLTRIVGKKKALEMLLTGEMVSAPEALRLGLVNRVVPKEKLEEATMELANHIAAKSPLAIQAGKTGFYRQQDLPYEKALGLLSEIFAFLCCTEDAEAGVKAFLERKPPEWKLR